VDVIVEEQIVRTVHGTTVVATHTRSREPFARVIDPMHFAGLWRPSRRSTGPRHWPCWGATSPTTSPSWTVAMSVVIHARVVEQLTRLRLRYVADRIDAVLNDAARTEPTYLDFLDGVLRQEVEVKQRTASPWVSRSRIFRP
jgi:hypothetical protein